MVPLGVITVAVVLAWGRFYQTIGEVVCDVAGALGSGAACAPGDIPDLSALLSGEGLPNGDGPGSVRCLSAASRSDPANRGVRGSVARIDVEVLRGTNLVPP